MVVILLAGIGFGLSLYTYLIEQRIKIMPGYKPACDLSDKISCSKVIKSSYANLFFISNAIVGMVFYAVVALLALLHAYTLLLIAAIGSCVASVFLASILYFKIRAVCIVCTMLYVINACILIMVLRAVYA